jgi:hypothetical protein
VNVQGLAVNVTANPEPLPVEAFNYAGDNLEEGDQDFILIPFHLL